MSELCRRSVTRARLLRHYSLGGKRAARPPRGRPGHPTHSLKGAQPLRGKLVPGWTVALILPNSPVPSLLGVRCDSAPEKVLELPWPLPSRCQRGSSVGCVNPKSGSQSRNRQIAAPTKRSPGARPGLEGPNRQKNGDAANVAIICGGVMNGSGRPSNQFHRRRQHGTPTQRSNYLPPLARLRPCKENRRRCRASCRQLPRRLEKPPKRSPRSCAY